MEDRRQALAGPRRVGRRLEPAHAADGQVVLALGVAAPRSVDFIDQLPRQDTGKLYKRLLRDRYWGDGDSRIV